ncbi:MAG: hypothetical protein AAF623_07905 [Planctomycetota bacterium]
MSKSPAQFLSQTILAAIFAVLGSSSLPAQYGNNPQENQRSQQQGSENYVVPVDQQRRQAMQKAAEQAFQRQEIQQPKMPAGFPLSTDHQQYVEKLLDHWEARSQQIEKFKCNFRRFEYDNGIVGWRDHNQRLAAHQIAFGEIRFAAPDRARYETATVMKFTRPPAQPGAQADYRRLEEEADFREQWICDGKAIYEFDYANSVLNETLIPPNMQGNMAESPLPFLFGVNKQKVLDRYWVGVVTPRGVENEYWLVAHPKRVEDSRMYSKVEIILAVEDFLPKALHMYSPQYDPAKGNEESYYFAFEDREVNSQLTKLQDFFGMFVKPRLPRNWRKVVHNPNQTARVGTQPPSANR